MNARGPSIPDPQRRHDAMDLLCDHALGGLDHSEQALLLQHVREFPDLDPEEFERAVAATQLALLEQTGPEPDMPPHLRRKVLDTLRRQKLADPDEDPPRRDAPEPRRGGARGSRAGLLLLALGGWLAAASLLLWTTVSTPAPADPSQARSALLSEPDLVRARWQALDDPAAAGVEGDVVWSGQRQEGYMRFVGLPRNDPRVEQYQLWIFDPDQDEATPIDGGVFDVDDEDALVSIDAKLRSETPTAFAVTLEKPGGVVVSKRDRLVLLAPVDP